MSSAVDITWRLEIGCLPYFCTWCGLVANLESRSEICCTRLAKNTGRKNDTKVDIWAPSHNFVGLYLLNYVMYRQSEKNFIPKKTTDGRRRKQNLLQFTACGNKRSKSQKHENNTSTRRKKSPTQKATK